MAKSRRNDIYDKVIHKMLMKALDEQETAFTEAHISDTDEQLLDYIIENAKVLQHAPRYMEIVGWKLVSQRFGTWNKAIEKTGLPFYSKCPFEKLPRIMEETERQKEIYRQNKAEKKQQALEKARNQKT